MNRKQRRSTAAVGSAALLVSAGAAVAGLSAAPAGASPANPVLVVNSLLDGSDGTCDVTDCTLREALATANSTVGADVITFSVTGSITLTSDLPAITEAVHVNGNGYGSIYIEGSHTWQAFHVTNVDSGTLEFTDLTVRYCANGNGPALLLYYSDADTLVEDVVFEDNVASADGGAINFRGGSGHLTVNRSSILYNLAQEAGGGLYAGNANAGPASGMEVTITNSTFDHNTAYYNGGGLYLSDLTTTITESIITNNHATNYLTEGGYYGDGGGIFAKRTDLTVVSSTVSGNDAAHRGGAIWADGYYGSGGPYDLEIDNSTISGNTAGTAAGVKAVGPVRTVVNQTTITGNATYYDGSPALQVNGASPAFTNVISGSIIVGNTAGHGGSESASDLGPANYSPDLNVYSSLIGWFSNYFNSFNPDAGTQTGVTLASLHLGTLTDNGGPTPTIALGAGSIAIDAGPDPVATFPGNTTDQRGTGYDRVVNGTVDVGAFEVQSVLPPAPANLVLAGAGGRSATLTWDAPVSGPTPTGYQVRCMPASTPANTGPGGKVVYVGSTATSATIADLTGGETYVCYVRARYGAQYFSWLGDSDEGPLSVASNTLVVARTTPPVPTQVQASTPPLPSGQTTQLRFAQPENRSGADITRYDARCVSSNGGTTRTGTGAVSPVGVGNLSKGRTYTCVVSAVNSVGPSAWSASSAAIVVPAGPPTNVRASTPTASNRRTSVSFTRPDGGPAPTGYRATCRSTDGSSIVSASGGASPVTVTNLVRGKTYTCTVTAIFPGAVPGPASTASNSIRVP